MRRSVQSSGKSTGDPRWLLPAAAAIGLVIFFSFLPLKFKLEYHTKGRLHLVDHFAAFCLIGFLLCLGARSRFGYLASALGAIALGICLEFLEHVVNHAAIEWADIAVDATAVLVATLVAWLVRRPAR